MAGETAAEDRTEAATPRRLHTAREQGRVAVSREVPVAAGLAAAALLLAMQAPDAARALTARLVPFLATTGSLPPLAATLAAGRLLAETLLPVLLLIAIAGAASVLLQTGFLFHPGAIRPDPGRLSPIAGLRRMFGPQSWLEAGKSLLKVGVAGWAGWRAVAGDLGALGQAPFWTAATLADRIARQLLQVLVAMLLAQLVIAALDLLHERLRHARTLRMSREEIRQEMKETEGDPRIKARIRQLRLQRARRRMLAAVPKAAVVVTNPTHYAVALAYQRGRHAAPRVVAKGIDSMAARIRAAAEQHGIPLVANPPLARALHRVELDDEIPAEHFQAVAEIIAYVWRLGRRAGTAQGAVR